MTHQITIAWNPNPGPISGYNVRRGTALGNESPIPLNLVPITDTFYVDNTVYAGQTYSYEVTAVLNGVESPESLSIISNAVPFDLSPSPLNFAASSSFAVLAGSTVTNVPGSSTVVSGDVGVSPGTSLTGFGAPVSISGVYHAGDFVAAAAQSAVLTSFNAGMAIPDGYTILGDIGGSTLFPGVYKNASSLSITGDLILDGQGDPNAVFIFQIGSTLTTAVSNSAIVLMGGAQAENVFWLVGSSATLNANTAFSGNILAHASITVSSNVNINGRLLAMTGAVTLDNDEVILFQLGKLAVWAASVQFNPGLIIFDGQNYQEVMSGGISGAVFPSAWGVATGSTTVDGGVVWSVISAINDLVILKGLPPSLPNTPPAPPGAPTGLHIQNEV